MTEDSLKRGSGLAITLPDEYRSRAAATFLGTTRRFLLGKILAPVTLR
jgi:hypothetical protein